MPAILGTGGEAARIFVKWMLTNRAAVMHSRHDLVMRDSVACVIGLERSGIGMRCERSEMMDQIVCDVHVSIYFSGAAPCEVS